MVFGGRKHTLFILRIIVLNSCPKIIGSNLIELFFARYFLIKINRKNSWLLPNEQARGKMTCKQLYHFQEKLGKALKGQKDCWMPCLTHPSWLPLPFIVFELTDNPVNHRKLKILQIIPLYRNANELSPVEMQFIIGSWTEEFCIYLYIHFNFPYCSNICFCEFSFELDVASYWFSL